METNKDYWSQALIVQCITLKLKMPSFEKCLFLVINQLS